MAEEKPAVNEEAPPKTEDVPVAPERVKELQGELETARGKARTYSQEAADRRIENKKLAEKIEELEKQLAGKGKDVDGNPTPKPPDAEAAHLRAELVSLKKKDEERDKREHERELKAKGQAHRSVISAFVARHKLEAPDDAVELLLRRTKLADDESTLLFSAKDKDTGTDTDLALTDENFEGSKLLGAPFWPAKGKPGSGGKEPKAVNAGSAADLSRIGDRRYWKENKEKVTEALKQQKA